MAVIPTSNRVVLLLLTGTGGDPAPVDGYEVVISDGSVEQVSGADTYLQEGPLTTFFRTDAGRRVVDSWSVRLASYRTSEIARIKRVDGGDTFAP
jgi:hypothetical protein